MILILISLISVTVLPIVFINKIKSFCFFGEVILPIIFVCGCIALFLYSTMVYEYFAAGYKKDIINREYKTNYTQAEVFYASDVINTIRELNRSRIEINGNIMQKEKN